MSFNKEKYEKQLDLYIKKINENNQAQSELEERETRKNYYKCYDYEKILKMDEEEFYEYISKLWAMIIWGNKEYIINKYINDNGKILPRRFTGTCAKHQRHVAQEVKRARFMGFVPFCK